MKNYYLTTLIVLLSSPIIYSQSFDMRLVHNGGGVLELQMSEVSGTGTPTTSDGYIDLNYALIWPQTCGANVSINVTSTDYFISATSGNLETNGSDYVKTFAFTNSTGVMFPVNWTTNEYETIAVMQLTSSDSGTCDICLATTDLIDDNPSITGSTISSKPNITALYSPAFAQQDYLPSTDCTQATMVPLPVELLSFTAFNEDTYINLAWESVAEIDFDGYWLERSEDGKTFKELAWVDGKGTAVSASSYNYQDKEIEGGKTYYYRLAMYDLDGSMEHSEIEAVKTYTKYTVAAFPKPTHDFLNIQINSEAYTTAQMQLIDVRGRVVYEEQVEVERGDNKFVLNGNTISDGVYMLIIRADTWQHSEEVVFLR